MHASTTSDEMSWEREIELQNTNAVKVNTKRFTEY